MNRILLTLTALALCGAVHLQSGMAQDQPEAAPAPAAEKPAEQPAAEKPADAPKPAADAPAEKPVEPSDPAKVEDPKLAEDVKPAPANAHFKSLQETVSYIIGLNIGRNLKAQKVEIEPATVLQGLNDAMTGAEPKLTDAEMQAALEAYQEEMLKKAASAADDNQKKADDFLAKNKEKEGIKVTDSGVQYEVIKSGSGKSPAATDTVVTHYVGTLLDGSEFDSSRTRGEPAEFRVDGVIAGWTEVLQLMKEGDRWRVYIPPKLAYGANPRPGGPIGPNELLVFDIELIEVK